ncbi:cbb3-type cytochrome c oxidase subunit I [Candidatus Gracilibacteria bacterium]|nr:cbb3-type cytochrome c oxidase subunit I [Candidatus Gracilibacteria bacterium]
MPRISQLMIRTALLQLLLGSTVGGLLLAEKGLHILPWLWLLRPAHSQMLLLGWLVQLACAVAIWILPRLDSAGDRGNVRLAWLCYGTLNGAVLLAALHIPLVALSARPLAWLPMLAGLLQFIAVIAAVAHLWPRVLSFRQKGVIREQAV